jgi:neutral ceramidase
VGEIRRGRGKGGPRWGLILVWGMFVVGGRVSAAPLEAGVARVDITPPIGSPMGGYSARQGSSTGVHDPLYASVLWLAAEGKRVAIVSCDLRSFPSARVVEQARQRDLADHVLLVSTHTHSGPMTWEDQSWPSREHSWFAQTEEKILQAIGEAAKKRFRAHLASGSGTIYLGHNRRQVEGIRKVTMRWRNEERLPTGPLDPTVHVLRIDEEGGGVRVLLVNYACHAVVLGPDNRQISADYPGALRRHLEAALPGTMALFLPGGGGDINPYLDKQPVREGGFEEMERMGQALGEEALRVARRLQPRRPGEAPLQVAEETLTFRDRWTPVREWQVGLITLLLDRTIALTSLPGEPFVDLQIAWQDRLAGVITTPLLVGYGYSGGEGWVGYIPTLPAAIEGGYGASTNTSLEVGAGEAFIDRAAVHIYRLLGSLQTIPAP